MTDSDRPAPEPQGRPDEKTPGQTTPAPPRSGDLLAVLPLRDIVVFPHMIVPLFVGREKSVRALEAVMKDDKQILLVAQKNAAQDDPSVDDIYRVGTVSTILQLLKLPDGTVKVLVEGGKRAKITGFKDTDSYFEAFIEAMPDQGADAKELEALGRTVVSQFEQYIKLNKKIAPEVLVSLNQIEEPSKLADTVASHLNLKIAEKQELLEIAKVGERLERVFGHMESEIGVLQVEKRIRNRVKRQMEKTQREYYLNEQLKAIQKELGEGEDGKDENAELEARIKKTKLSKEAREKAMQELKKLKTMSPMSAEATVVRNYLDWMLSIPWKKRSKIRNDVTAAEKVLEADHYGLEKVKERIIEYLAVQARSPKVRGSDPVPGGTARRRQDLAGQVGGDGDGAQLRSHVAGRRARRGGDPRPSAHLYRLDARQGDPGHEEGEDLQSAVPAGRGRQAGCRLARRSFVGAAGGAGSGAELHLRRSLSGGGLRPVRRDVRHHGELPAHAAAADGPHGDHPHPRLHRG